MDVNLGHELTDGIDGLWQEFLGALLNSLVQWLFSLLTGLIPGAE